MKNLVRKCLSFFGIGIYRISRFESNAQGLLISDPIYHNSKVVINEFYSDPERVELYANSERCRFYEDVLTLMSSHGIDFHGKSVVDVGCCTVPEGRRDTFLGHINFWSPESWREFVANQTSGSSVRFIAAKLDNRHNFALVSPQ